MWANDIGFKEVFIYLLFMNILSFCLFAWDKKLSRQGRIRISERNLLLSALMGGSVGGLVGMYVLRHKTRHLKFKLGIPFILLLHLFLLFYIIKF